MTEDRPSHVFGVIPCDKNRYRVASGTVGNTGITPGDSDPFWKQDDAQRYADGINVKLGWEDLDEAKREFSSCLRRLKERIP